MNKATVAETPAKRICSPAKLTDKVTCGERRKCVSAAGATALVQPFPTEGQLFDNQELAAHYGISSIPALLIFKDGKVVSRHVGVTPEATLRAEIQGLSQP